jgi:type II secretory pathway pseudopilin PulG
LTGGGAGPFKGRKDRQKYRDQDPQFVERGQVLILALVYIVAVSIFVGALAYWATNDLNNTTVFKVASAQTYAANAATQGAVQDIGEYPVPSNPNPTSGYNTPTPLTGTTQVPGSNPVTYVSYPSSPGICWGSTSPSSVTINGISVSVWCSTVEYLKHTSGLNGTRVVTFYTCLSTVATAVQCEQAPLVKAVVSFDDLPGTPLTKQCNLVPQDCGQSDFIVSWVSVNASSA